MAYPSHNSTLAIRITRFFSLALYQSRRGIHDHHHGLSLTQQHLSDSDHPFL
nr:MAG TPA: hypothetical protein [Caudoviricetes sp.]